MSTVFRVKHTIYILSALDSDEKLIEFERQDEVKSTTLRQDFTKGLSQTRSIPASTTDEVLSLGDVTTAKFLYMETDQELTIKLNGNSDAYKLTPTSGAKAKLLWEGEFTEIKVTNASSDTDAVLTYHIAG
jgi:hypothetical protein